MVTTAPAPSWGRRRPLRPVEIAAAVGVVGAWAWLVAGPGPTMAGAMPAGAMPAGTAHAHTLLAADAGTIAAGSVGAALLGAIAMTVAMMGPALTGTLVRLAGRVLRRRVVVATIGVAAGYVMVWAVVALVAAMLPGVGVFADHRRALHVVALAVATVWQFTTAKQRALDACHRDASPRLAGLAAVGSEITYGAGIGVACVGSCWAIMLATLTAE